MTKQTISLDRVRQISINASDLARAEGFYREKLGIKHLFTVPSKMAFFDCSGLRLMLAVPERADLDHPSSIVYFQVDDIEAAHAELEARGVRFETGPALVAPMGSHDLWLAEFRDSENNVLALLCEKPKAR